MRRVLWLLKVAGKIRILVLCPVIAPLFIASPVCAAEDPPVKLDQRNTVASRGVNRRRRDSLRFSVLCFSTIFSPHSS